MCCGLVLTCSAALADITLFDLYHRVSTAYTHSQDLYSEKGEYNNHHTLSLMQLLVDSRQLDAGRDDDDGCSNDTSGYSFISFIF